MMVDQGELARKWRELRKWEKSGKKSVRVGRPTLWDQYEVLFAKHGELTIGDLMTKLGRCNAVVRANLCNFHQRGLIEKEYVAGLGVYRLAGFNPRPTKAQIKARRAKVLELTKQDKSIRDIAKLLGASVKAIKHDRAALAKAGRLG
jgi:predicted ArsR family transcriptional regulator